MGEVRAVGWFLNWGFAPGGLGTVKLCIFPSTLLVSRDHSRPRVRGSA